MSKDSIISYISKWEFLKFKIREFSISFGKSLNRSNKLSEINIINEINTYCLKTSQTEDDKQKLQILQTKLDEIYLRKAEGAYIRSRAKWIEEGEKSTSYFCRLEKRRQERNAIKSLLINNQTVTDPAVITMEIISFYSKLYSSSFSNDEANNFFNNIQDLIPTVEKEFAELCDADITSDELDNAVNNLSLDKSPGSDGLTANFYKHFWDLLKEPFSLMLKEATDNFTFPSSMKQGIITLIPKPGKNPLKKHLHKIISDSQSGFMSGRSIHNNIRLVLDLLDYNNLIEDDGFILFHKFINIIESLYDNSNSCISLPGGTSPRFSIKRGVKQGCPISPFLFIISTEMLSIHIKNSNIAPLDVLGKSVIISQLADDTTIFMKQLSEVPKILHCINSFSKASGLKLNLNKCELMPIHQSNLSEAYDIPIKSAVKYLGIFISKDSTESENNNIWKIINECQTKLNSWLLRDISLSGRIFLTKLESLSRCIYPAYSLSIPNRAIKKINQVNFDYIWKKKTHYIRRVEMIKDFKDGGLQAIDFDFIHGTLKINWLKGFLNNNNLWYHIPREIFNKVGGIELLLKCDFTIQKLPIKLSSFHQQVLLYWKLLYNHNFTPHNTPIWNNRYITVKNKSLYNKNWMEKEIWSVIHLVDRSGDLLSYNNFCLKYNLVCNRSEFKSITKAIPKSILNLIKGILTNPTPICPHLPQLLIGGCDFNEIKIPNKTIRNNFNYISYPSLSFRNSISQFYGKDTITMLRTKYLKFPITPKAKELHFKTLNGVYPSSDFLRQRFGFETNNCIFCDECETTDHLFF
ncbi:hypothetical protein LDENG_00119260 [Lucifuga dentata]|nr:hypothetical protein LDENG_00119260 [Lucifuga dentata]